MFSFSVLMVNAELSLTTTAIKNYKDQWYIVSDNVTTYWECSNMVKKYNTEYPSYKRSECFKDGEWYKYFICQTSQSCEVAGGTQSSSSSSTSTISTQAGVVSGKNSSSSSSTTTSAVVPNKEKLDKFVTKIESLKSTMTDEKFEATLTAVLAKLEKLSTKYSSNTTIAPMLAYLKTSIADLKNKATQDKDVDNFFCELTDSCDTQTTTPNPTTGSNTSTQNSTSTGSTSTQVIDEILSVYATGWLFACGNPDKNDYTTFSPIGWVVKVKKTYCETKWGYVWTVCGGKQSNIKSLRNVKNNDTFVCNSTQTTPGTATGTTSSTTTSNTQTIWTTSGNSTSWNTSTISNDAFPYVSVSTNSIDFWTMDGGILPLRTGKKFTSSEKIITIRNTESVSSMSSVNGKSSKAKNISAKLSQTSPAIINITNECAGKELAPQESCNIKVSFTATDSATYISSSLQLVISGDIKFNSNTSNAYSIALQWKVEGFCEGEWYSRDMVSKPAWLCSTVQLQSWCYSSAAFSVTKVLDACVEQTPTSSTLGTWIGNSLWNSQKRTDVKANICYMWDGGNFNPSVSNTTSWDSYSCMRKWAVPELANSTYFEPVKYPTILLNRKQQDNGISFSRSTRDTDSVLWSCNGPSGKTFWWSAQLSYPEYFTSWDDYHNSWWVAGIWTCTWTLKWGTNTKTESESFTIQ